MKRRECEKKHREKKLVTVTGTPQGEWGVIGLGGHDTFAMVSKRMFRKMKFVLTVGLCTL